MSDMPAILDSIRERPDDEARWLALAGWYWDHSWGNEAAVVRVFWPMLRDNLANVSLEITLAEVARDATLLGLQAREVEERRDGSAG